MTLNYKSTFFWENNGSDIFVVNPQYMTIFVK